MGEIDSIKEFLTGEPVPYRSANEQACALCADINEELWDYDVPQFRDQELQSGDEVIFLASRRRKEDGYLLTRGVNHLEHNGEFGSQFTIGGGTQGYHDAIVTAVVECTGFDFGKKRAQLVENIEYEPDVEQDALTLSQVDVMAYSNPQWGDEDDGLNVKKPDSSDYATKYKLNPAWPAELQKAVASHIDRHR